MEASAVSSFSSTPQAADPDTISLVRLSTHLECLLNPAFLNRADADIVLAAGGGAVVGAYSCILAARSPVLHHHISSLPAGERPRLELAELVRGGDHIGREALEAVLGYMYTGIFKVPLQECADKMCSHGACRPAIDFVVESTYAACGFQIPELVSLCQRRMSHIIGIAYNEDLVPIIHVASTCQLLDLLNRCIEKVAMSALDNYREKQLPGDIYSICFSFIDQIDYLIRGPYHEKTVKRIHEAMDSDDVGLVGRILKESSVTLDDAFAIHYAAACCTPKMLAELLKLNSANVNLTNSSGYTPLHMACMRLEPGIILSLVEKGRASVLKRAFDGRDALTICKRLAREKDFNRELEKGKERSNACLCIDILEKAMEKCFTSDQVSVEDRVSTALLDDNLHMSLLEYRVNFARLFFPSQVTVAMDTAEVDATEEFTATSKLSLKETPTMQNRRLLYVLTKTVEIGKQYFPNCSFVIDKFLEEEATDLALLENDNPESQRIKRTRFCEIREEAQKAFNKDMAAGAAIPSTESTSSSPRLETLIPGTRSSQAVGTASDSANAPALPFGLYSQAPGTPGTGAGQLESQGSDVVEVNKFCVGSETKLKSPVWNEMERVKIGDDWKGKCSWCKKLLSASSKNGTKHLHRHLKSCQPRKAAKGSGPV